MHTSSDDDKYAPQAFTDSQTRHIVRCFTTFITSIRAYKSYALPRCLGFRGSLYSMSENDLRHFFVKDTSLLLLAKFKIAAYIRECIFASIFSLFSFFR